MKDGLTNSNSNYATPFLRKAVIIFLILALMLFTGFTVLFVVYDVKSINSILYVLVMQHIMWLFGILYFKNFPVEPLIQMYLFFILAVFYPIACIFWDSGDPVVFFWYLIIIIGAIVFDRRNLGVWIPWTLAIVFSIFFTYPLFPHEDFAPLFLYQINLLTVISSVVLASFFAIIFMKQMNSDESGHEETLRTPPENVENPERDKALYDEIIHFIKKNKSFKNPDFNAHSLAIALNTNATYISKAISRSDSDNFNMLLNEFRINYVKSMLDNGALKKYTIDYIYAEAGYKHRSTFNAAFKSITGMTPSEYVSRQNTDDNQEL